MYQSLHDRLIVPGFREPDSKPSGPVRIKSDYFRGPVIGLYLHETLGEINLVNNYRLTSPDPNAEYVGTHRGRALYPSDGIKDDGWLSVLDYPQFTVIQFIDKRSNTPISGTRSDCLMMRADGTGDSRFYHWFLTNGTVEHRGAGSAAAGSIVIDNGLHMLATVRDGSNFRGYVDDQLNLDMTVSWGSVNDDYALRMGGSLGANLNTNNPDAYFYYTLFVAQAWTLSDAQRLWRDPYGFLESAVPTTPPWIAAAAPGGDIPAAVNHHHRQVNIQVS